jgi:hypothetical protein
MLDADRRWTLARVAALIARLSGVSCTPRDGSYLLHRFGSPAGRGGPGRRVRRRRYRGLAQPDVSERGYEASGGD